ncbi:10175_t:CDS:2 [Gigaspora margarita]|uniref:10175_t:CDS:1 n=1 Tax=Gigaspora margarita TaxID=4874 RepID=A0ABN7VWE0_GIGMA|nr:10175_t:CDS:2 [Gigaspora margarita]
MTETNVIQASNNHKPIWYESFLDRGFIPDFIMRLGVRNLLQVRLKEINFGDEQKNQQRKSIYVNQLKERPIAEHTNKANEQHYEVSTEFMQTCLGQRMKYSCCLFPNGNETLDEAEECMLESYCVKARLQDGMNILDLGCGWGSLCLYLCEKYPNANITALSNSSTQREYINGIAQQKGFKNLNVITADVKEFDFNDESKFDRILSIEMFEHMKNYEFLFSKISNWLKPQGLLFVHIFCHREQPYDFVIDDGWMAKYFFTADLFSYFQTNLRVVDQWTINGIHYSKTSEAWLKMMDKNKIQAINHLKTTYGEDAVTWFHRWRTFYLAVAELFKFNNGNEWCVTHYLFEKKGQ